MDKIISTMKPFFDDPTRVFGIRELGTFLGVNHTTVRQRLHRLRDIDLIEYVEKNRIVGFRSVESSHFKHLKIYSHLEDLRLSGLIHHLESHFDYPTMVLFGSYALAEDRMGSDIDIFVLSEVSQTCDVDKFERIHNRKIQIHCFQQKEWSKLIINNNQIVNSIVNGLTLKGYLDVLI